MTSEMMFCDPDQIRLTAFSDLETYKAIFHTYEWFRAEAPSLEHRISFREAFIQVVAWNCFQVIEDRSDDTCVTALSVTKADRMKGCVKVSQKLDRFPNALELPIDAMLLHKHSRTGQLIQIPVKLSHVSEVFKQNGHRHGMQIQQVRSGGMPNYIIMSSWREDRQHGLQECYRLQRLNTRQAPQDANQLPNQIVGQLQPQDAGWAVELVAQSFYHLDMQHGLRSDWSSGRLVTNGYYLGQRHGPAVNEILDHWEFCHYHYGRLLENTDHYLLDNKGRRAINISFQKDSCFIHLYQKGEIFLRGWLIDRSFADLEPDKLQLRVAALQQQVIEVFYPDGHLQLVQHQIGQRKTIKTYSRQQLAVSLNLVNDQLYGECQVYLHNRVYMADFAAGNLDGPIYVYAGRSIKLRFIQEIRLSDVPRLQRDWRTWDPNLDRAIHLFRIPYIRMEQSELYAAPIVKFLQKFGLNPCELDPTIQRAVPTFDMSCDFSPLAESNIEVEIPIITDD
jgi:hypothetical protein